MYRYWCVHMYVCTVCVLIHVHDGACIITYVCVYELCIYCCVHVYVSTVCNLCTLVYMCMYSVQTCMYVSPFQNTSTIHLGPFWSCLDKVIPQPVLKYPSSMMSYSKGLNPSLSPSKYQKELEPEWRTQLLSLSWTMMVRLC